MRPFHPLKNSWKHQLKEDCHHDSINLLMPLANDEDRAKLSWRQESYSQYNQTPNAPTKKRVVMKTKQRKKIFGSVPDIDHKHKSGDSDPLLQSNQTSILENMSDERDDYNHRNDIDMDSHQENSSSREGVENSDKNQRLLEDNSRDSILPKMVDVQNAFPITCKVMSMTSDGKVTTPHISQHHKNNFGSPVSPTLIQTELLNLLFIEEPQVNSCESKDDFVVLENGMLASDYEVPVETLLCQNQISPTESEKRSVGNSFSRFFTVATKIVLDCCAPLAIPNSPPSIPHSSTFQRMMTKKYIDHETFV